MADGRVNNGGKRVGSGRKTAKHEYIDDGLLSPLQLMLQEMRNDANPVSMRLDVANKAAPYCHAKLLSSTLDVDADLNISLVSYLDPDPDPQP